jgi:hypothetical protein
MHDNCQWLADFFDVLDISLIWLCICEICESVVCVICDSCDSVRSLKDRHNCAAYRPGAPCLLIFLVFSLNLGGAPYKTVRLIVQKLRYMVADLSMCLHGAVYSSC